MVAVAEAEQDFQAENDVSLARGATRFDAKGEAELLDALYEVLAQGVPAGSAVTVADVETFLHEHARSRKSVEEMQEFFHRHNLSMDAASYGADAELSQLASGLHRERGLIAMLPLEPAEPADLPAPTESGEMRRALPSTELEESSTVRARAQRNAAWGRNWKYAAAAVAVGALLAIGVGVHRTRQLEGELERARLQLRTTDSALTSLEQRAEGLRGALDQSEQERRALASRFEQFTADAMREQATEQDVLRRLLGKRYETLRAQISVAPTPAENAPKP